MNTAMTVTAMFVQQFSLTVERLGGGSGTVISNPPGISCGGICATAYDSGTEVESDRERGTRFEVRNWSGACVGTETSCLVAMDQVRSRQRDVRSAIPTQRQVHEPR